MAQRSSTRLSSRVGATILFSIAFAAAVSCSSYPKYPDVLWACDNRRIPDMEPWCSKEERGEDFMTIGFYESINGPLIFRDRDYGAGIACKIIEIKGRWAQVELTTGRVGYVNFDELTATTPIQ